MKAKGELTFEVLSIDTGALVEQSEYDLPPGMPVVDLSEKLQATPQQVEQMKQMTDMMEQIQQSGGEMKPEMQQQMQQMMEQMQQLQTQ